MHLLYFFSLFLSLFILEGLSFASGLEVSPSYQGYSGLIHVPDAEVTADGTVVLSYNNHVDPRWRDLTPHSHNYLFHLGIFPHLEVAARLTEAPGVTRDLSANFKVQVPYHRPGWPRVAFGGQDIESAARHFHTWYGVISQDLPLTRLSLGYGLGPDRLEGVFGGVDLQPLEWLHLVGEYDTEEVNVGLRLWSPEGWLPKSWKLGGMATTSLSDGEHDIEFSVSLKIPLPSGPVAPAPSRIPPFVEAPPEPSFVAQDRPSEGVDEPIVPDMATALEGVKERLVDLGFQNVRAGIEGEAKLIVEYQNSRFNYSELDGLGVVMGTVAAWAPEKFDTFLFVLKNDNIRLVEIDSPAQPLRAAFALEASLEEGELLLPQLRIRNSPGTSHRKGVRWVGKKSGSDTLHAALMLHPGLSTSVGTELGVLDYRLSLLADVLLRLWPGSTLNARWDVPVAWSDDYAEGRSYDTKGTSPVFERLFLNQAFRLAPGLTALVGGGQYLKDVYGGLGETQWLSEDGRHRLTGRFGYFDEKDDGESVVALGSYRYFIPRYDLFLEATYGRYFHEDVGVTLALNRFFGDTRFTFYLAATGEKIAGFRVSLPLTPRRDMKPYRVQVRGSERWTYDLHSVVDSDTGRNDLRSDIGVIPQTVHNLERSLHDADRLHESYLRRHFSRAVEAYRRWGLD